MNIQGLELNVFFKYRFPNLKYLCINESNFYLSRKYKNDEVMLRALDLTNPKIGDKRNDTDVFVDKVAYTLMPCISKECPKLEGIEFNCLGASFREEAFAMLFQSCLQFRDLRYVSLICDFPLQVSLFSTHGPKIFKMTCTLSHDCGDPPEIASLKIRNLLPKN